MIRVELVSSRAEADEALDLAEAVWGSRPISVPVLRALEFAGLYLSVARDEGALVGMCAGFVGMHDEGPHLHSHLACVVPALRGRGIGAMLKWHQREWCLGHGIDRVSWTFDPLIGPNARFNLHHLGAAGDGYLVDLYGAMDDAINAGDESDRLLVTWDLRSERVLAALDAPLPAAAPGAGAPGAGAEWAVRDEAGEPVVTETGAAVRLVATPTDIVAMRRTDPARAKRWRLAVRGAMADAFDAGLRPSAMTADLAYVLER